MQDAILTPVRRRCYTLSQPIKQRLNSMRTSLPEMDPSDDTAVPRRAPGFWRAYRHRLARGLAVALMWLLLGRAEDATSQQLSEVTNLIIVPLSPSLPFPCDASLRGCHCCQWDPGKQDYFNLFLMSDLRKLSVGYQFNCLQSGIVPNLAVCCEPQTPSLGQVAGYLVQRKTLSGSSVLGFNSSGQPIPIAQDCP